MRAGNAVLALVIVASSASAQDRWESAEKAIVRLLPSAFPALPMAVRSDLNARHCRIPQAFSDTTPHNVLVGPFITPKSRDWVVLCSNRSYSTILVYRNGRAEHIDSLGTSADAGYLQGIGGERIGYSLKLEAVGRSYIREHNPPGSTLPPITHLGINVMFVEKASSVAYYDRGKWRTFAGGD